MAKKKIRILFSLTYYTPYLSGLTLYVKRLAEALVKKGHKVSVLTMNFDHRLPPEESIEKVRVVRADYWLKISKGFLSIDWIGKSWREVKNAEVVFLNLPQFESLIPALIGKLFGKKVFVIYHCEVDLPPGFFNTLVEWVLFFSHFLTLLLSEKIITYTEDFAQYSKLLPIFKEKLLFSYPPIIEPKVNQRIQKILKEKIGGENKKEYFLGVAARLAAEKGIEYLLEAIPFLKKKFEVLRREWKIIFVGSLRPVGEEAYQRKILKLVEKYKRYVVFLGELKEEEMGSFYSLCDVLVLPSINSTEAFGMVQVEAMMMGVPVVATDLPGVRVPIKKTGMGLIVPIKDSQKLAEAIGEVLINQKKYLQPKELIKKEFSFGKTIEFYKSSLEQLYQS